MSKYSIIYNWRCIETN